MKKTIKISLQGMVFFIDEDADLLLGEYLSGISDRFPRQEEREEILPDIETRIAEIFTDRLGGKRQVVTLEDVKAMISLLGRPEDIFEPEEGEDSSSGTASPDPQTSRSSRRLFRDPGSGVLLSRPELDIVLTGSGKPELEIYKRARGNTRQAAVRHAEDIDMQWETRDKVIILRPWYRFGKRWHVQ